MIICGECSKKILKSKNEVYQCFNCKKILCGEHSFQYVDESNCAITKNSPILCKKCYKEKYDTQANKKD